MIFRITISATDGTAVDTECEGGVNQIEEIESFIRQHDHEGSFISINIHAESDDAYSLIRRLADYPVV